MRVNQSHHHAGQALIEALVGATVLVLVLLLLVALAKVQAVELAATHAARALAFDCAVQPDKCTASAPVNSSEARLRARFMGTGRVDYGHKALWRNRSGDPLVESGDHIEMSVTDKAFGAASGVLKNGKRFAGFSAGKILSRFAGPDKFGLHIEHGLITTSAGIGLRQSQRATADANLLSGMALKPSAKAAMLLDSWQASGPYGGPHSVDARVDKGRRLKFNIEKGFRAAYLGTKAAMISMRLLLMENQAHKFEHYKVPMDLVPIDRTPDKAGRRP
ncbi:MAG: hypothetical protein AB8C46_02700 [Burkholderiaceae bacterium]